jgi:hypothetical protein
MGLMSLRGFGQTCPNGGSWDSGLQVCCAPAGTPALQDPCSILNNPAFIQQQNTEVAADIASIPASSFEGQTLAALVAVPINIGQDAVYCQSNPGLTFVDAMGVTINCPSPSISDVTTGGQPMSTYTTAQLAQMLNAKYGGAVPETSGDKPYVAPPVPTVQPTQKQLQTVAPPAGNTAPPGPAGSSDAGSSTGSTSSTSSTSGIDLSFLTNSDLISGLPNWAVAVGAIAALMILPGLIGGRR